LSRGIVTDAAARTVTFHLTTPDPELLYKLSVPEGAVVPADAPRRVSKRGLPGTGPYTIARYDGKRQLRLVRNPYFHVWSQAAKPGGYPDAIVLEIGGVPGAEVTAVERGRADVAFSDVPPDRIDEVTTQYPAQVHVSPQASTFYLQMNTREPPFDDVRARRAVNYALDRGAIVRAVGGSNAAQPTCQVLPPNFPGYSPYCPYTLRPGSGGAWTGPDLAKARALVRESGTSGEHVTLWFCSCFNQTALARIERAALEQLGYRTTLKLVRKIDPYFKAINDTLHTRPQIANAGWIADYPAASNFFNLLTCANATPSPNAVNTTRFCDAAIDREITRAGALQASDPHAAVALWRKIDRQVTDDAPWAALYTPRSIELVSARVGNYQLHPLFGLMPDQLWVK